jgi:hypothetical protein
MAKQKMTVAPNGTGKSTYEQMAARNARTQECRTEAVDQLHVMLPKALKVLAEELEGENRLHAAVHVLKACKLYGAEVSIGPTEVEDVAIQEKERLQKRRHRELMVNLI